MRMLLSMMLCLTCVHIASSQTFEVSSPTDVLQISFFLENGVPYYRVMRFGNDVIRPSRLGFLLGNEPPLAWNFAVASTEEKTVDETWTQVWGEKKDIRNTYTELRVDLVEKAPLLRKMTVVFRAYDDGVGFRYEIPKQDHLGEFEIMDELTEFVLTGDHQAWWIPAYWWNRYEYLYRHSPLSEIDSVHTPVTMETEDGLYLSFHEAALTDFSSMALERTGDYTLKASLFPWSDGVKVRTSTPLVTPWRTIQIADTPGGLITSYLILNLNEPTALDDVSWIRPGKYVGIWWEMHLGIATWGSGEHHGATTENAEHYIDFAAKYGFDGVLVEGWNVGWDGDWIKNSEKFRFTEPYKDFDIEEVVRYASDRGVQLIGHHETGGGIDNYARQMDDAYGYYQDLGVHIVKSGYVAHDREIKRVDENGEKQGEWHHGQYMVRHYQRAVEEAAKHQIMLDVHEPIKDTGIRRTWPNLMTREGARGQEFNAWAGDGGNPPEHTAILPFTRFLGGPMDFTPGIFNLLLEDADRPDNRVNTTLAKQLALYVVLYSPLQMAADLPKNYEARPGPFQFIVDVPTDWEDTRVLNGRIGDYITTVRKDRHSEDWYLGSLTDENGRVLEAPLQFLDPGKQYVAEIYRDGEKADWVTNPYDIEIEKVLVDNGTMLALRLAPGGGQAIRFRPATEEDIRDLAPARR